MRGAARRWSQLAEQDKQVNTFPIGNLLLIFKKNIFRNFEIFMKKKNKNILKL